MMIQITQQSVMAEAFDLPRLRAEFAEQGSLLLPNLFAPAILAYLVHKIGVANFVLKHEGSPTYPAKRGAHDQAHDNHEQDDHEAHEFGTTLFMPPTEQAYFFFHLLLNKPALFTLVEQITGCGPIGNFMGRIHRTLAHENQQIDWHDDIADTRLVGLNVNLSTEPYQGGRFQLREKASQRPLGDIGNVGLGNAFLFRVSPTVEHRLTPVEGYGSRTVGVGWFRAQPDWQHFASSYFKPSQNQITANGK